MKTLWAKNALLENGWANSVQIDIENGKIVNLHQNSEPQGFESKYLNSSPFKSA